eukprot:4552601-Alexandrium_andersonii.AAC.1
MKNGPQAVEEFTTRGELRGPLRKGGYIFLVDATRPMTEAEQRLWGLVRQQQDQGHNVRIVEPGCLLYTSPSPRD